MSISQQRFYDRPGSQLDAIVCFFLPIYTMGLMVAAYSFGWLFEVLVRARKEEYRLNDIQRIKSVYSHLCKYKIIYIILFGLIFVHFSLLAAANFLPKIGIFPLSDIHYAAELGSIRQVKKFLNKGVDINAKNKDENGETPLHTATLYGHRRVVEFLIESGAIVDSRDNDGRTALHDAGWGSETEVVNILIRHGADVNAQDNFGDTSLHRAVHKGRKKTVQNLLKHGVDVNLRDKNNQPPLFGAVWWGYKDVTELLLKNGAEVNFVDKKGRSPLSVAVEKKYKDIEKLLREHGAKE
jgi:ankyrin repeat protein